MRYDDVLASWQGVFGGDLAVGYREFVEAGLASPICSPFDQAADGWILGSDAFVERIRGRSRRTAKNPRRSRRDSCHPGHSSKSSRRPAKFAAYRLSNSASATVAASRRPIVAYLGQRFSGAKLAELAEVLGLGRRDSVPNLIRRAQQAPRHSPLRVRLDRVTQRLAQTKSDDPSETPATADASMNEQRTTADPLHPPRENVLRPSPQSPKDPCWSRQTSPRPAIAS